MCFFVIQEGSEEALFFSLVFWVNKRMVCPMDNKTKNEKNRFGKDSTILFLIESINFDKDKKMGLL